MQFGNLMNVIYAPESNDDDLRDSRDEPKKRDNRPGKLDPYLLRCVFLMQICGPLSGNAAFGRQNGVDDVGSDHSGDGIADDQRRPGTGIRGGGGFVEGGQEGFE